MGTNKSFPWIRRSGKLHGTETIVTEKFRGLSLVGRLDILYEELALNFQNDFG